MLDLNDYRNHHRPRPAGRPAPASEQTLDEYCCHTFADDPQLNKDDESQFITRYSLKQHSANDSPDRHRNRPDCFKDRGKKHGLRSSKSEIEYTRTGSKEHSEIVVVSQVWIWILGGTLSFADRHLWRSLADGPQIS